VPENKETGDFTVTAIVSTAQDTPCNSTALVEAKSCARTLSYVSFPAFTFLLSGHKGSVGDLITMFYEMSLR